MTTSRVSSFNSHKWVGVRENVKKTANGKLNFAWSLDGFHFAYIWIAGPYSIEWQSNETTFHNYLKIKWAMKFLTAMRWFFCLSLVKYGCTVAYSCAPIHNRFFYQLFKVQCLPCGAGQIHMLNEIENKLHEKWDEKMINWNKMRLRELKIPIGPSVFIILVSLSSWC